MVLSAHVWGADKDYGGASLLPFQLSAGIMGVDLFFLISGFVMVHVAERMDPGRSQALRFMYNRGARIYPVYWVATLTMIVFYWGKFVLFGEATQTGGLFRSLALLPQPRHPIVDVGWTLVYEMYFYVAFFLILLAAPRRKLVLLVLWGLIIAVSNLAGWVAANAWTKVAFNPLTFEFLAGAGVAVLLRKLPDGFVARSALPALLIGLAAFAVLLVPFDREALTQTRDHGARALTYAGPFALILYGAAGLERAKNITAPRWLIASGDASYSIYLFHIPVLLATGKSLSIVLGDRGLIDNVAIIATGASAALAVGFAVHRFIEKPMLVFTRRLGDRLLQAPSPVPRQERIW